MPGDLDCSDFLWTCANKGGLDAVTVDQDACIAVHLQEPGIRRHFAPEVDVQSCPCVSV